MSVTLPIGPLQIIYTGGGPPITGTIQVTLPPAGSPPGINASVVIGTAGNPAASTQPATVTTSATNMTLDAEFSVQSGADRYVGRFRGNFTSRLQGSGTSIISSANGVATTNWTAQLGETNVPFRIGHTRGHLTISTTAATPPATNVTFTLPTVWQSGHAYGVGEVLIVNGSAQKVTAAGISGGSGSIPTFSTVTGAATTDNTVTWTCQGASASSVTVALDDTGAITPSPANINLGTYTSVGGTFTSNTSGNGTFFPGTSAKRGGSGDNWVTQSGDK